MGAVHSHLLTAMLALEASLTSSVSPGQPGPGTGQQLMVSAPPLTTRLGTRGHLPWLLEHLTSVPDVQVTGFYPRCPLSRGGACKLWWVLTISEPPFLHLASIPCTLPFNPQSPHHSNGSYLLQESRLLKTQASNVPLR